MSEHTNTSEIIAAADQAAATAIGASPWKRRLARTAKIIAMIAIVSTTAAYGVYRKTLSDIGPLSLAAVETSSRIVEDRNGALLRPFTTPDGRWRLPVKLEDVDDHYVAMLLAFEDRRFYQHDGIDEHAIIRAIAQAFTHGRLVSGGSTLTMQVARLIDGKHERTAFGKLRQMLRARQLEQALNKREILDLYLRLAPFGGNLEGIRAATLAYFGKEPKRLSIGEAAILVALPQSPERRRIDRGTASAKRARDRVLDVAMLRGVITKAEGERAKAEAMPVARYDFPKYAPHQTESEIANDPTAPVIRLTLDRNVQGRLERLANEQAKFQGEKLSVAVVVADHQTGEILAQVGSSDYLDAARFGPVDMTTAVRSPGSTLKPFIYGLAFEQGLAHPETLIDDRPVRFGNYAPKNFDEGYHGAVSIRESLAQSLNIPAVRVLARVGPGRLVGRFRRAGVAAQFPDAGQPTLAMALGGTGMTMLDLTQLYAALARGGDSITLYSNGQKRAQALAQTRVKSLVNARRLMSPLAAWYVTDILKDAPPPANAKGGRFAYKTGTSYGYRDAWAVGYDGRHVITVWVGRADGASVPGLMGRINAAPILFDAFERLGPKRAPLQAKPADAMQIAAADLPPPLKRWREPGDDVPGGPFLKPPVLIAFPPDQAEIDRADFGDDAITLKADGGALPLTWLIDGVPVVSDPRSREVAWQPPSAGFAELTVIDADGKTDRAAIRMK